MKIYGTKWLHAVLLSLGFLLVPSPGAGQLKQPEEINRPIAGLSVKAADPFDIATGIYFRDYVDLFVNDTIPIRFVRTQRNMDPMSRSFGIGGSTSYDMFIIGDVDKFSWVALVLADGGQIRYARVSPGRSYADGVFENQATPGEFLGSRISWNQQSAWTVAMRNGTEYTVQGCNAKSKPGQCAVTEVKNAHGERLTVQRDRDGNIVRITSPHDHFVSVTTDLEGRITRVEDDSQRWVTYRYDEKGCLVEAHSRRGDRQTFRYDSQFNMTFVHERVPATDSAGAYTLTTRNFYDLQNRFSRQLISNGDVYSANYITDSNGSVRETDVHGPTGLSRYFFDVAGYETRLEFRPLKGSGWILERAHHPISNVAVQAVLSCKTGKIDLSLEQLEQDTKLGETGEARTAYLSQICRRAEK